MQQGGKHSKPKQACIAMSLHAHHGIIVSLGVFRWILLLALQTASKQKHTGQYSGRVMHCSSHA
jgi:hypothetical protein